MNNPKQNNPPKLIARFRIHFRELENGIDAVVFFPLNDMARLSVAIDEHKKCTFYNGVLIHYKTNWEPHGSPAP